MPSLWTTEQVTGMAPDAPSIAAGRKLAQPAKWGLLGASDDPGALWGEIAGSGSKPYQVCIDMAGPAFKCSCPSRKFPCKHALALAFVYAEAPQTLTGGTPPDWVQSWLDGRSARAERQATRAAQPEAPVDPEVAAKRVADQERRAAARRGKVADGVEELQRWLGDMVRQGLAAVGNESYQYWDRMAARLVDAQAPGLARRVRGLAEARHGGGDWHSRVVERVALLHLLVAAFQRRDGLEPGLRADVESLVGFTRSKDELLGGQGVSDQWWVLGRWMGQEDELRVQRTWLWGTESGRHALLLDFAVGAQAFETSLLVGSCYQAELVFYPGAWELRALPRSVPVPVPEPVGRPHASFGSVAAGQQGYAELLAGFPWVERYPLGLAEVQPVRDGDAWFLVDSEQQAVPLATGFDGAWVLLALSGGRPLRVFGEWDGEQLSPLAAYGVDRIHSFAATVAPT